MKLLTIIPMRSGSKGITNKNMTPFCGKALCRWTIDQAKAAGLKDIMVATDSEEYRERLNLWYPTDNLCRFLLPAKVTKDKTRSNVYLSWILDWVQTNIPQKFDTLLLLEPTSPIRCGGDINEALKQYGESKAKALISVCDSHRAHPALSFEISHDGTIISPSGGDTPHLQRQELRPYFHPTGTLYITNIDWYRKHQTFITGNTACYRVNEWQDHEIDHPWDLKIAASVMDMIA
jgi:CMP-N,N'-diacetyllegionaminic acid synthase